MQILKPARQNILNEVLCKIIKNKKYKKIPGLPNVIATGTTETDLKYFVIEKFGPTLKYILKKTKNGKFSVKTSIQIGI